MQAIPSTILNNQSNDQPVQKPLYPLAKRLYAFAASSASTICQHWGSRAKKSPDCPLRRRGIPCTTGRAGICCNPRIYPAPGKQAFASDRDPPHRENRRQKRCRFRFPRFADRPGAFHPAKWRRANRCDIRRRAPPASRPSEFSQAPLHTCTGQRDVPFPRIGSGSPRRDISCIFDSRHRGTRGIPLAGSRFSCPGRWAHSGQSHTRPPRAVPSGQ